MTDEFGQLRAVLKRYSQDLIANWTNDLAEGLRNDPRIGDHELSHQMREFIDLLSDASGSEGTDIGSAAWAPLMEFLEQISRSRAQQGFSSEETANFIFSFRKPLFECLRSEFGGKPMKLAEETWTATTLLDRLGLHTVKTFQRAREDIIRRQQEDLLELSTPVVKLWNGILALPMIGVLDSARTQLVMESLLQRIVEDDADIAIIDITGVPTVDTLTAQHLLNTVSAIRMMGADCIISGIRPQIAQTIVHLGVELQGVVTKANLADALSLALKRLGYRVSGGNNGRV